MAQHLIALDIGPTSAKVAVIAATFKSARLERLFEVSLKSEMSPDEVWGKIKESIDTPYDSMVASIDAKRTSVRNLTFPFDDLRRVQAAVDFELEGQMPYAIEDAAIGWFIVERESKRLKLLAAVTPKEALAQSLAAMSRHHLEPRALMLPSIALLELIPEERGKLSSKRSAWTYGKAQQEGVAPEAAALAGRGTAAVLCLGHHQSHLCVARAGPRALRSLRFGGLQVDRALSLALNITEVEAKALKEKRGRLYSKAELSGGHFTDEDLRVHEAIAKAFEPLITGLVGTFRVLDDEDKPQRVVLTGGLSKLLGVADWLAAQLAVPVQLLDVEAALGDVHDKQIACGPEHATVLGLALALWRYGQEVPLNFRRGALAYRGDLQLYRGLLSRVAAGFVIIFALAAAQAATQLAFNRTEERELDRGFCEATLNIVGKEICDPTAAIATMRQSGGEGGTIIPSFGAASIFEMLSKQVPPDLDMQLDELDLRVDGVPGQPEHITGKGEAQSFEATEQLSHVLKRDPCVTDVEISKQRKTSQAGRVEFNLVVKVLCPAGSHPGAASDAAKAPSL